jgi:uncharacterized membrane-anchored protein
MSKTLKLTVQTANEQGAQTFNVIQGGGKTGQITTVRAVPAARYQLQDADNNAAPEKIKAKRMGKNLHLSLDASNEADLIIEGYYDVHTGTESGSIYTQLQDGAIHEYIAGSTGENLAISKLTDGASFVEQVISPLALDGAVVASAPAIGVVASVFPGALGAGAVGAVAVAEITKKDEDPIELSILRDAAQNNSAQAPAITAQTYAAAGVTGVTEANVAAINSALNSATITGAQAGNRAQLQAIVNAYKAIQDNADGTANNNATNPTQAQYAAIGVTGVSSATTVGLLGDVIDSKPFAAVDTVGEVQALADAANAVMTGAAGGTAPTLEQLQALGLTGVTSDNLPAVLAAIKATPDDGMGVDSLSELQAVVTAAADAAAAALDKIKEAAQANDAGTTPALADFAAAGVTGVTADNLAAVSSALNSAGVNGAAADTTAEVQAIVNGFNAILANAGDTANTAANVTNATQAQYAAVGVTGVSSANAESLLGDAVDGKPVADIDTVGELQALANAANAVLTGAAGGTAPTLAQLQALGITGVTADNLPAVLAAIAATADDGTGVNTLSGLQDVVTTAATAATSALTKIKDAAQADSAGTTPALADFAAAGVTGVTADNLAAVSSALNSAGVNGAAADTTAEVQAIVNGFNAILANAGDTANTAANVTNATQAQYAAVGVTGVSSANAESLLGDAVDGKPVADIDTVGELQALANAANAVLTGAAGGTAPTLAQLQALGITGVTADNLPAVLAAIAATADDGTGVNTLSGLQDVVTTAATAATSALTKIKDAAQADSAGTTPALADFAAAGVTGVTADNLAAVSSALNSAGVNGAAADTTAEVQAIVNGFNAILANAGDTANTAANVTNATQAQYAAVGVTGVSSANAESLLGDAVDGKPVADIDTVGELQALANAANAVLTGAAGGTAPTQAQLEALGITGVTADNLPAVLAAIIATPDDGTGVNTLSGLQDVVTAAATAAATALTKIKDAADANNAGTTPAVADFVAAGVTGVTPGNLAAVSSALNSAGVNGAAATTTAQVQAIVNGFNAILANAGDAANTAANVTNPTQAQYEAIGVTGVDTAAEVSLLGDVIDGKDAAAVGTAAQVQALADAASAVMTGAAGGTAPTLAQLQALGVTGVTADNLPAVLAAISATADDGTGVNTLSGLQGVVTAAATAATSALTKIKDAAQADSAGTTPALADFAAAGVTGVTADNLAAVSSALNSAGVNGAAADTTAEVQAIVNGFNAILANAGDAANTAANVTNPTQAQYEAIGVTGVDTAAEVSLLGDVIDGKDAAAVGTAAQVQALADAASAVMTGAAGGTAPTLAQLQALGVTGVTADNLPAVLAAISATADDGTGVNTLSGLQGVVTAAATAATSALTKIKDAAQADSAGTTPALADFAAAGVTGVTADNLAAVSSALNSAGVNGAAADTTAEVQAIVNGFNAILANAGDAANTAANVTNPTQAQYEAIGVTGVDTAAEVSLLGDVIDGKDAAAVGTAAQVQALADAASAVMTGAAGGTAPTLAQLQALGVTGVTADNLPAVLAAISATADDGTGVNTLSGLQGVVTAAATAATSALTKIKDAAQADSAGTTPALADFAAAGVTGVTADNLAAVSSALNSAGVNGAAADTTAEVQAIVNGFNAILANAGDAANTAANVTNPTQAQYEAIGVTGVDTAAEVSLLGDVIDGKDAAAVGTAAQVQALADAASAVMTGAAGGTAPTLAQLQALGIANVNEANLANVQAAIAATANDGSGVNTLAALQAVVSAVNDSPVVTPNATPRSYAENDAAIAANNTLTLSDADSTEITGATVQITTGLTTGDVLAFATANGISSTYDSATGKLTLTGTATVAQYQAALRAVTYSSTSENPAANTSRTLTWQVNDGAAEHNLSTATTSTINVTNLNDAPVLADTTLALAAVLQGAAAPTGAVGSLVSSLVGGVTDADTGAAKGVAITAFDSTNGKLFFSTNGGTAWTEATGLSNTNALLLASDSDNRIYFQPNSTFTGTSTSVTMRAWDKTTGSEGDFVSTATNGGSSAFSAATDTVSAQVVRPVTINAVSSDNIVAMNEAAVITGKADANATVTLNVGGTARTVTANGSGDWSYTAQVVPVVRYVMVRRDLDDSVTSNGSTSTGVFSIADITVKEGNTNLTAGAVTSGVGTVTREAILSNATNSLTDGAQSTAFEITTPSSQAWVQVDLGGNFRVDQVLITARSGWASRLNGSKVYMSSTNLSGKTTAQLDADAASGLISKTTITNPSDSTPFTVTAANSGTADLLGNITASESVSGVSSSASTSVSWRPADKITIISAEDNTIGSTPLLLGSGATTGDKTLTLRGTLVTALTGDQRVAIWSDKDPVNGTFIGEATVTGTNWEFTLPTTEFPAGSTTVARGYDALITDGFKGVALATSNRFNVNVTNATAPVVIDLNRDGELAYADVAMDISGDGHLDQTAWAGAGDGVLVWDKFADGVVHNNSQYAFAQYQTTPNADGSAATDLQGLGAGFDSNQDGVFDANDAKFAEFKVWQDANQNGVSEAGEVRSLADVGISSIDLTSDGIKRNPADGVTEAGRTTAAATDGSEVLVADAAFEYSRLAYTADAGHLNLLGTGMNLDLSSFTALHGQISEVNLNGSGANTLKINLDDVLTGTTLKLQGGSDDTVALFHAEGWSQTGTSTDAGVTYNVWHHTASAEQLLIDQHLQVITA